MNDDNDKSFPLRFMLKVSAVIFLKFLALGLFFATLVFCYSFFVDAQKADLMRLYSCFIPVVLGAGGILKAIATFLEFYLKWPKNKTIE